jgi:membrane-associated phospholipid phosphatase
LPLSLAAWCAALVCLLAGFVAPPAVAAAGAGADTAMTPVHPDLRWTREGVFLGGGISLLAAAQFMDVTVRPVPPEGLDPGDIRWAFDREQIGKSDTRASTASDRAGELAMAYPMVVAFASQQPGERINGTLRRSVVYLESMLIATGTTEIIKHSAGRPRPYNYLPAQQRPDDPTYDVTQSEAFHSMPSGHASASFCGAAFAMTDHLLSRPQAGWIERAGVAFTGGLLAGMTSSLRVSAGKHFPSDVITGGAIGISSGVVVPMTHHYLTPRGRRAPLPSGRAWLQAIGGLGAGIGAGILIAEANY